MSFVIPTNTTWPVTIPDATKSSDGVMTKEQVQQLENALETSETDVLIYLSTSGNDNNPGTIAAPVLTVQGAQNKLPFTYLRKCQFIFLTPGIYDLDTTPGSPNHSGSPPRTAGSNNSEPFTFIGLFTNEIGDRTSDNAPSPILIGDSTLALAPNAFVGATLLVLTGMNAGQRRLVKSNNGTTFFINDPFLNPTAPGDTFRVERPAVQINYNNFYGFLTQNAGMKGIKWNATSPDSEFFLFSYATFEAAEGCEFALNGTTLTLNVPATQLNGGSRSGPWQTPLNPTGDPFNTDLRGPAGCYIHDGVILNFGFMSGYYVFQNVFAYVDEAGIYYLNSFASIDSQLFTGDAGNIGHVADPALPGSMLGNLDPDPATGAIVFNGHSNTIDGLFSLDISNMPGHGILAQSGAFVNLRDVTGAGNVGAGLQLDLIASANYDPAATTITGALGDTIIGTTPKTWAAITAGPGFTDGFNSIFPKP